jgi:hypothetical protein
MRKPKHYSVLEVLNFSDVGLTFEFYSTKASNFIVEELGSLIGKNVILTNENCFHPSYSSAILLKEYEAKRARYQFTIAQQNYHSVLPIIDSVSKWISESCETTIDTQLKVSLSFNHRHLDTLTSISMMNPTRLILKFDESEVYKRFPEQRNSPYALSIKNLAPITNYINESEFENNIRYILTTPYAEFYGINFKEYTRGILECNYVGGFEYADKPEEIKQILEYFIMKVYQTINEEDEYNDFERFEIKRLTENFDKMQMAYYNPEVFLKEFANLKVYVDLKTSTQTLKTYWDVLRKPLFELIVNGGLREGQFNYDAQIGRFQLRKGRVGGISLKNMDLVSCDLTGIMENCSFVTCDIKRARIYNSKMIRGNKISESYLEGASMNKSNELNKCFVLNDEEMINCEVNESVIKFASPGKDIKVDEKSTVIIKEVPLPQNSDAIKVEGIRDYSWIKSMRKHEMKGFGNAYNKDTYTNNITKEEDD